MSEFKAAYKATGMHYAKDCKEATKRQYTDLKKELESLGYNLTVTNDARRTCWRYPTAYEIKFGEGAIHYRDFTEAEIGRNKKGILKKWFKAEDGEFYHTH